MSNIAEPTTTTYTIPWEYYAITYSYTPVMHPSVHIEPPEEDQDDVEEAAWRSVREEAAWRSVRELLTPQEKRLLSRYQYLPIRSRLHPGFTYRIHVDADTPQVYYRGEYVGYLCIDFFDNDMPNADTLLMHKLWIEGDEAGYLREANSWRDRGTPDACAWLDY